MDQARSGDTGDHYWDRCKRNAGNQYFKKKPAEHFKDNPDQLNYGYNFTKIEFLFNGVGAQNLHGQVMMGLSSPATGPCWGPSPRS